MGEHQSTPAERLIHRGRKFDFAVLTTTGRSGRPIEREIVRHPGAVILVPILGRSDPDERELLLVRQTRPAPGKPILELPAGTLEPGENPFGCAARELEEETGHRAATVTSLGRFYTSPGMSDELMHAFVATDLQRTEAAPEDDEDIEVVRVRVSSISGMIEREELADGKSLAALTLAVIRGVLPADTFGGGAGVQ
ncbi:MAG: NUDIX hydrolase [Planctomycetota bacterium]